MSEPIADDEVFLRLVGQHLAGDLTPAEREVLAVRLRADPQARTRYRDLLAMDVLLHDQAGEQLSPTARIALRQVPHRTGRGRRRSRATRRPPLALWVGLAAAAAMLVLVALQAAPRRASSPIAGESFAATLSGTAEVWRDGAQVANEPLRAGDTIVAANAADVVFPDHSRLVLAPGSRLRLEADQKDATGARVHLENGTARCELRPQARGFRLATAHATVAVLGTSFTTSATAQTTAVAVASGRVRIDAGAEHAELAAGDRAEVTANVVTVIRATPIAPAAVDGTGVADFTQTEQWIARGPLPVEIGRGRLEVPPAPIPPDAGHIWHGRSWQWHQPLPATTTAALSGVLHIPAGSGARDWQAELFCADAATTFDVEEGQPATCLRLVVRDRRVSVQELVRGPDSGNERWQAESVLSENSEVTLGLHLEAGGLTARVDGRVVWQGALSYERVLLGIRISRRRSDTTLAPVLWRTVTLTTP